MTRALIVVALLALVLGCEREARRFSEPAPLSGLPQAQAPSELRAGPAVPQIVNISKSDPEVRYDENAWAVSMGKWLYSRFNCVGCHAQGGGGMGPALMDDRWIYGSEPAQIFAVIVEGRPNGMPAFGGKIPQAQVWQLVAYVRSLSGQLSKDVSSGRADHMAIRPSEQRIEAQAPKLVAPGARAQ